MLCGVFPMVVNEMEEGLALRHCDATAVTPPHRYLHNDTTATIPWGALQGQRLRVADVELLRRGKADRCSARAADTVRCTVKLLSLKLGCTCGALLSSAALARRIKWTSTLSLMCASPPSVRLF